MDTTTERLVRMLDEEREGHRKARDHAGQLAQQLHNERGLSQKYARERVDALNKVEDWERFGRALQARISKLPEKQRSGWPNFPEHFDDIPF